MIRTIGKLPALATGLATFALVTGLACTLSTLAANEQPDVASPPPSTVVAPSSAGAAALATSPDTAPAEGLRKASKRLKDYGLPGLDKTITLTTTTETWDIVQLIEFLALKGGLNNIIIGKGVAGPTPKLRFDNITVGDALDMVLAVNGLAYEVKNGVITILTDQEYSALYGASFYDNKQVQVVDLSYADAVHVATMLGPLKSAAGTVISDPVTGTLILVDTPARIAEMKAVIEKADIATVSRVMPTETKTFTLKYADVADVQAQVTAIASKEAGSVRVDTRTKTLVVTDLPHNMRKIESLVNTFDIAKRQVFIEAKIMSVLLQDDYKLGINWNHLFDGLAPRVSIESTVNRTAVVPPASGVGTLTYKTMVAGGDLTAVVDALKTIGETKILSNPHVAALSDQPATIKVVTDQPYAEAQLESGTTNVVGENIKFIEVGVKLEVTPRISGDGFISMAIKPEISDVVGQYSAFRQIPIVRRSYAETTVMIRDGETVIIGGMIQNKKSEDRARVPFLGRIPLVGVLFRSRSDSFATEETVVFLTPRIITGDKPVLLMRDMEKEPKPPRAVGREKRTESPAATPVAVTQ